MMRIERYMLIAAMTVLSLVSGVQADIVTVGPNGEDHATINEAINATVDGDEIVISAGVYPEQLAFQDQKRTIRAAGNGEVIISGQDAYTPIRAGGTECHIVLDSITIRDGYSLFTAGGISIHGSAFVEIDNCIIEDNYAGELGGGIYCEASAVIRNSVIRNNIAGDAGGGAATQIISGEARLIECVFEDNQAVHGGGFSSGDIGEAVFLDRCRFTANTATQRGGAVAVLGTATEQAILTAQSCIFENNAADEHGGAVWVTYNDMFNAVACLFARNEAQLYGAAISTDEWVNALNCTFADNRTVAPGVPDTFSGNRAEAFFVIRSCIITNEHTQSWRGQGNFAVRYSLLPAADAPDGGGFDNIHADPMYRDPDGLDADPDNDFDILAGSPVIDRADALESFNGIDLLGVQTDLLARNRLVDDPDTANADIEIWGGVMDIGAYEYNLEPPCVADFTKDGVLDFFDVSAFLTAFNAGCP